MIFTWLLMLYTGNNGQRKMLVSKVSENISKITQ